MNYWQQQGSEPLFPDVIWSKPETKRGAGKLLIVGGQAQEFSGVAAGFMAAEQAGPGTVRVIMPDSTQKVTRMLPNIEYAPSNPSGSFSKQALATFLDATAWADHVFFPGDLGKNSETTTIMDGYLLKCPGPVTIAQDALLSIAVPYRQLLGRPITLVLDIRGLQKLGTAMELEKPVVSVMSQPLLAEALHLLTVNARGTIVCTYGDYTWVSARGRVSSTKTGPGNVTTLAAKTAVWAMQHPTKLYEALTTSLTS